MPSPAATKPSATCKSLTVVVINGEMPYCANKCSKGSVIGALTVDCLLVARLFLVRAVIFALCAFDVDTVVAMGKRV